MTHQRQTIRDAIVTILEGASIVASGSVYSNRLLPVWESRIPLINVYTATESSSIITNPNAKLMREMSIVIEAFARDLTESSIDDTLDDLAESIESAMDADYTLSGTALDSVLSETAINASDEGASPVGTIRLTYTVKYLTT